MILNAVLDRFVQASPVTVMLRASLEYALSHHDIDQLFDQHAQTQYTRELLFSSVVDVLSLVVCRIRPSVHKAYQAHQEQLGVSAKALYDKLAHTEPQVCSALVRHVAGKLRPVLHEFQAALPSPIPGYPVRILDGNHLAKTDRRLKPLRALRPGPLPGQALVVLDPQLSLVTEVLGCEDAHAQERSLLDQVLPLVEAGQVWMADRNFCTTGFLFGLHQRQAFFLIRQHRQTLHWQLVGQQTFCGQTDTGRVYEQKVLLSDEEGNTLVARRITVQLHSPTRDGDRELHLLTNLPTQVSALTIAAAYRQRWRIETAFAEMEKFLQAEITTLAHPKAALLAFSVGLLAYNIFAVIQGALRHVHGTDKVTQEVSAYALTEETQMTYRGMMVALGEEVFADFANLTAVDMAQALKEWASHVRLEAFPKFPRGPKKPVVKKPSKRPHVSTARVLKESRKVEK